jgi:hypothetical protein
MPDCSPSSTAFAGRAVCGRVFIGAPAMVVSHGLRIPALFPPRHCERSEAIHGTASGDMDCFVASLLAMTVDIPSPSRGADRPRFAFSLPSEITRAQGRPGARCTRGLACDLRKQNCTRAYRAAGAFRPSLRNGFTAYFELSPVNGSFATVAARKTSAQLDASTAASEPHDFAVRSTHARLRALRVHRISPHVRDDGQRPSSAVRRAELCG